MNWELEARLVLGSLDLSISLSGGVRPVTLIGPNGAGKTTVLRILAGAIQPSEGRLIIGEQLLFDSQQGIDIPPERRGVGYVPQGYGLFPHLTVLNNVAFGWASRRMNRRERRERALRLLHRMGAEGLADRDVATLSGGEKQRVALARALGVEPSILLLDEPMAALDAAARRSMRDWLARHLSERLAPAVVVSHDVRDVRALNADVVVLEGGRVVQQGSLESLEKAPATAFVAEFLGH